MSRPVVTPASIRAGQVVDLAGVATHLWAPDVARAAAMASMLRAAKPASGPLSLTVRFEDGPAPALPWTTAASYEVLGDGDVTSIRTDLGLVARVESHRIDIFGDAANLDAAFRLSFSSAFAHVLAWRDRYLLHAAALVVDDGCVLVLGPSGAGKSTVAVCALRSGWPVLGDDLVVVESMGARVVASAIPRPIAAPRDIADDPRAAPVPSDPRGRVELPTDAITSGVCPVLGLIVTAHTDSLHSTLHEIHPSAVPPLVFAACLAAGGAESRRSLFRTAMALSRLPAFELAHGTRATTRVDDGAAILQALPFLRQGSL